MATQLQTLITTVRDKLNAPIATDLFWTDAELLRYMNRAIKDLWRAINDNYQDYFLAINEGALLPANSSEILDVPEDLAILREIEPLATGSELQFEFRAYNDPLMRAARRASAVDPSQGGTIYYCLTDAGAPVGVPSIFIAPQVTADVELRLAYVAPIDDSTDATDVNPIPGESDMALINFTLSQAISRQGGDENRELSAEYLAKYATDKANLLVALTPRQTRDDDVVQALFEEYWP